MGSQENTALPVQLYKCWANQGHKGLSSSLVNLSLCNITRQAFNSVSCSHYPLPQTHYHNIRASSCLWCRTCVSALGGSSPSWPLWIADLPSNLPTAPTNFSFQSQMNSPRFNLSHAYNQTQVKDTKCFSLMLKQAYFLLTPLTRMLLTGVAKKKPSQNLV